MTLPMHRPRGGIVGIIMVQPLMFYVIGGSSPVDKIYQSILVCINFVYTSAFNFNTSVILIPLQLTTWLLRLQ